MNKKLTAIIVFAAAFAVFSFFIIRFINAQIQKAEQREQQLAAETAAKITELAQTVPQYYEEYYTEESAAALQKSLDAIPENLSDENADLPKSTELQEIYDNLQNSLNGLTYRQSEVAQFFIITENGGGNELVKDDGYVNAEITLAESDGSIISDSGSFKVRGNSTAKAEKKPYKIQFDSRQNMLEMGSYKKWLLLANCFDPTMMRNHMIFDFARQLGFDYVPQDAYVELWLDGVYKGCYELTEPIEVKEGRLDIDVKGNGGLKDFLIEFESQKDDMNQYFSKDEFRFAAKEPEKPDDAQTEYMSELITQAVNTVQSGNFEEIQQIIDVESFAKLYLLNEFCKNVDFGYSSVFFYYIADEGKFYAGPPWDYDLCMGDLNSVDFQEHYVLADPSDGLFAADRQFYLYLCQNEEFMEIVKNLHTQHTDYIANLYAEGGFIDSVLAEYEPIFRRNFSQGGWSVDKVYDNVMKKPQSTYQDNVEALRTWIRERDAWLREYWEIGKIKETGETGEIEETEEIQEIEEITTYEIPNSNS